MNFQALFNFGDIQNILHLFTSKYLNLSFQWSQQKLNSVSFYREIFFIM